MNNKTIEESVCIVGCGFVGVSLLKCFSRVYKCVGFDISQKRIEYLSISERMENVNYTTNFNAAKECKLFMISVPTPLFTDKSIMNDTDKSITKSKNSEIDMSIVEDAVNLLMIQLNGTSGNTIVLESSVAVGTSEKLLKSLHDSGNYCGFSPERVDPGRETPKDYEIPKIISGYDSESLTVIKKWYGKVYDKVVPVSSMATAEMCKLYENCFRMVNIAYVNEIADACVNLGINPNEMITASATKPFGFMPFHPGLFVGGSCININPHYLKVNCNLPLLELATQETEQRPFEKATYCIQKYNPKRVLAIGVGFKAGQSSTMGSGTIQFIRMLQVSGINVDYYDPLVKNDTGNYLCRAMPLGNWTAENLEKEYDLIAICMRQIGIDYNILSNVKKINIIDFTGHL